MYNAREASLIESHVNLLHEGRTATITEYLLLLVRFEDRAAAY